MFIYICRPNIAKMSVLKLTYRFNSIPTKSLRSVGFCLFYFLRWSVNMWFLKNKGPRIVRTLLKKKNKVGNLFY